MKKRLFALALAAAAAMDAAAQAPHVDETPQRDRGLTFNAAFDLPLSYDEGEAQGEQTQGEETFRSPRISLTMRYSPPATHLFARLTAHAYLDRSRKAPWNPDFTYSFGYEDWRPGTLAVTYDNYNGNRFNPDDRRNEKVTRLEEGTISVVYKIPISETIEAIFVPKPENRLSASVGAHFTPRFHDESAAERGEWKQTLSLGLRNRFYRSWYVEARAYYYPVDGQQQSWDPDYTYGLGWFDWRPGKISVQYSNYAANRFPGREQRPRKATWRDGAVSVSWSHTW